MVDAVGGVEICVPEEINDPAHQIFVPAGTNELRGDQALDYVPGRATTWARQSDLGRIKRQQNFMASMINKVVSSGHADPPRQGDQVPQRGHQVARRRARGWTASQRLGDLALQLRSTGLDEIKFVTVPWEYDDDYNVLWLPASKQLFESTSMDEPLSAKLSVRRDRRGRPRGSDAGEGSNGTPSSEAALTTACAPDRREFVPDPITVTI